jgi:transcriptional regulator of acetoin/glycerol metabolism
MKDADSEPLPIRVGMTLAAAEKVLILATVEYTAWRIVRAASMLGIDRSTLYAKLKLYGIEKPPGSR